MQTQPVRLDSLFDGKTVLIVDDNATLRLAYGEIFFRLGCNVLTAADGEEAVSHFRQYGDEIGLVVLDLNMPRMNGEEVYRQLRATNPALQVIISTSCSQREARQRLGQDGDFGYLRKPFPISELINQARHSMLAVA